MKGKIKLILFLEFVAIISTGIIHLKTYILGMKFYNEMYFIIPLIMLLAGVLAIALKVMLEWWIELIKTT